VLEPNRWQNALLNYRARPHENIYATAKHISGVLLNIPETCITFGAQHVYEGWVGWCIDWTMGALSVSGCPGADVISAKVGERVLFRR
jgi:hypothetical protein